MQNFNHQLASISEKANKLIATNLRKQAEIDKAMPLAIELAEDISDLLATGHEIKIAESIDIDLTKKPRIAHFAVSIVELSIDSGDPRYLGHACVLSAASMDHSQFYHELHYTLSIIHFACQSLGFSMTKTFDKYSDRISDRFKEIVGDIGSRKIRGLLASMQLEKTRIDGRVRFKAIR